PPVREIVPAVLVIVPKPVSVAPLEMLIWLEPVSVRLPVTDSVPTVTFRLPELLVPVEPPASVLVPLLVIVPELLMPPEPVALIVPPASLIEPALLMANVPLAVRLPVATEIEALLTTVMPPFVVRAPVPCMVIVAADPARSTVVALGVPAVTVSVWPVAIVSVVLPAVVPVIAREAIVVLPLRMGWFMLVLGIVTAVVAPGTKGLLVQLLPVVHAVLVPPIQVAVAAAELRKMSVPLPLS